MNHKVQATGAVPTQAELGSFRGQSVRFTIEQLRGDGTVFRTATRWGTEGKDAELVRASIARAYNLARTRVTTEAIADNAIRVVELRDEWTSGEDCFSVDLVPHENQDGAWFAYGTTTNIGGWTLGLDRGHRLLGEYLTHPAQAAGLPVLQRELGRLLEQAYGDDATRLAEEGGEEYDGDTEEELECEGHESLAGADMGASVFCDGSCVRQVVVEPRMHH